MAQYGKPRNYGFNTAADHLADNLSHANRLLIYCIC